MFLKGIFRICDIVTILKDKITYSDFFFLRLKGAFVSEIIENVRANNELSRSLNKQRNHVLCINSILYIYLFTNIYITGLLNLISP